MSQENLEVLRRMVDAFNRGDRDAALIGYAPDVEWHTTGRFADEGIYRGPEGVDRLIDELRRDFDELQFRLSEIRAVGHDKVFAATTFVGRGRRSKARVEQAMWFVHTFAGGLVVRVDNYSNRTAALEAAGLSE